MRMFMDEMFDRIVTEDMLRKTYNESKLDCTFEEFVSYHLRKNGGTLEEIVKE